mgnify:CR=1 FL=1
MNDTMPTTRIAIVTVSDRASRGEYEDLSGPAVEDWLRRAVGSPCMITRQIVPDGIDSVRDILVRLCDEDKVDLIFTSGGTEADNLAVAGVADASAGRVVCSATEHPAVLALSLIHI